MNYGLQIIIVCPLTSVIKNIKGCVLIRKNQVNNLKKILKYWSYKYEQFLKTGYLKKLEIFQKSNWN